MRKRRHSRLGAGSRRIAAASLGTTATASVPTERVDHSFWRSSSPKALLFRIKPLVVSSRSSGVGKRAVTRVAPTSSASRAASASTAAFASAPTSSSSLKTTSPSLRCAQPPTMRPSCQTVGPMLPVEVEQPLGVGAEVPVALLPAHRVGSSAGEEGDPRLGRGDRLERRRRARCPRRALQLDLDRLARGERPPRLAHRPAGPPLQVDDRRRAEGAQPAAGELGLGRVGLPAPQGRRGATNRRAPSGTGCSSTTRAGGRGRSAAPPPAGRARGSWRAAGRPTCPRRSRARVEPGDVPRELGARGLPALGEERERRAARSPRTRPRRRRSPSRRAASPAAAARCTRDARRCRRPARPPPARAGSTQIVRRIACMRTSVRSLVERRLDRGDRGLAHPRHARTGTPWPGRSSAARRARRRPRRRSPAFVPGARRWRTPSRARRSSMVIRLRHAPPIYHTPLGPGSGHALMQFVGVSQCKT